MTWVYVSCGDHDQELAPSYGTPTWELEPVDLRGGRAQELRLGHDDVAAARHGALHGEACTQSQLQCDGGNQVTMAGMHGVDAQVTHHDQHGAEHHTPAPTVDEHVSYGMPHPPALFQSALSLATHWLRENCCTMEQEPQLASEQYWMLPADASRAVEQRTGSGDVGWHG